MLVCTEMLSQRRLGRDGCHGPCAFELLPPRVVCSGGHCIGTCKEEDVPSTSSHSSLSLPLPSLTSRLCVLGWSSRGCCKYVRGGSGCMGSHCKCSRTRSPLCTSLSASKPLSDFRESLVFTLRKSTDLKAVKGDVLCSRCLVSLGRWWRIIEVLTSASAVWSGLEDGRTRSPRFCSHSTFLRSRREVGQM